jgi:hypothetical protein
MVGSPVFYKDFCGAGMSGYIAQHAQHSSFAAPLNVLPVGSPSASHMYIDPSSCHFMHSNAVRNPPIVNNSKGARRDVKVLNTYRPPSPPTQPPPEFGNMLFDFDKLEEGDGSFGADVIENLHDDGLWDINDVLGTAFVDDHDDVLKLFTHDPQDGLPTVTAHLHNRVAIGDLDFECKNMDGR